MSDRSESGPQKEEDRSEEEQAGAKPVVEEERCSGGAPMAGGEPLAPETGATRDEGERRSVVEISGLAGEESEESAAGFYVILGLIVVALLVAVTWLSGSRHEVQETEISRPAPTARASRPALPGPRSPGAFPSSGGPGQPLSMGARAPQPDPHSHSAPLPPAGTAPPPILPQGPTAEPNPPVQLRPPPGEPIGRRPGLPPATIAPSGAVGSPYGVPIPPPGNTVTPPRTGTTGLPLPPLRP